MFSFQVCFLRKFALYSDFQLRCSDIIAFWNCKENEDFEKLFEQQLREASQIPKTYAANVHFLIFVFRGKSIYMGPKDLSPLNLREKYTGTEKGSYL